MSLLASEASEAGQPKGLYVKNGTQRERAHLTLASERITMLFSGVCSRIRMIRRHLII